MHGMLSPHVGMRISLLDVLEKNTLVKDAEGEIVRIEPHLDDRTKLDEAVRMVAGIVYLTKFPKGIWVCMRK